MKAAVLLTTSIRKEASNLRGFPVDIGQQCYRNDIKIQTEQLKIVKILN